ncbi:MAG: hypothetical protein HKO95_17325 [Rhodobacteraceae bacterium]|jgi:uncharacterized protein YndB with AHSA1/START domain|nr:SRPBCC domain-containing protein [Alphaproteobacteria bacterium]MBT8476957.1 SRPBCC domain-containing protein [Alphaproteobacteria bacterium]NNK68489.1 hypothetical protein [Paracoccaceae bacterium]
MNSLEMTLDGDTGILCKRRFAAPPEKVFKAHTDIDLLRQWMLGPDGWTISQIEYDARPGGKIAITWENGDESFSLSGHFVSLEPPHRIVHVERFHMPDPTPDNHIETMFEADGDGTLMVMRMQLPDKEARDAMIATGMEEGMSDSYDRLDALA